MTSEDWSAFLATLPEERQIEYSMLIDRLQSILAEDRAYILGELDRRCAALQAQVARQRECGGET